MRVFNVGLAQTTGVTVWGASYFAMDSDDAAVLSKAGMCQCHRRKPVRIFRDWLLQEAAALRGG
ncbi:MAG: hypothetical protein ACSHXD_09580 [Marinosulfonomonas sp.]